MLIEVKELSLSSESFVHYFCSLISSYSFTLLANQFPLLAKFLKFQNKHLTEKMDFVLIWTLSNQNEYKKNCVLYFFNVSNKSEA